VSSSVFLFHEFTYQWVYITYMFAYVHLWAYSSVFNCIGLLLYTIEDRNYVLFTLTSPLQSALCGILQVLKLAGRNEYACDKWISFGCMATMWVYLHISGEVFSWASVTCVSIWMGEEGTTRMRRFGRGGQAGARKQETAGNRRDWSKRPQVTGVTVSLAPTLRSVGFQNRAPCFPFLLALSKFSCTIPI